MVSITEAFLLPGKFLLYTFSCFLHQERLGYVEHGVVLSLVQAWIHVRSGFHTERKKKTTHICI